VPNHTSGRRGRRRHPRTTCSPNYGVMLGSGRINQARHRRLVHRRRRSSPARNGVNPPAIAGSGVDERFRTGSPGREPGGRRRVSAPPPASRG
jgi:hypothetical protein